MSVILMTTLFYKALILQGEIWCWSLILGLKGGGERAFKWYGIKCFSSRSEVYNLVAREARVYHTSIARSAWFPLGYKSIEFGCCPPWRHQVSDVRAHYGFPGNRLPSSTKLWVLFMKTVFFHLWIITMFTVGKSPNISSKTKENSKLSNGGFNKWLEILAGKGLQTKLHKSEDVDFKFSASIGTAKANTVN